MTSVRTAAILALVLSVCSTARADEPLAVEVDLAGSAAAPSAADIRQAIGRELGVETVDAAVVPAVRAGVQVRVQDGAARVRFVGSDGGAVSRSIDLPADPVQAAEAIALLAGNLGRRQADALLAELLATRRQVIVIEAEEPPPGLPPPPAEPAPPVAPEPPPPVVEPAPPVAPEPAPVFEAQPPKDPTPPLELDHVPVYAAFVPGLSTDLGAEWQRSHAFAFGALVSGGAALDGVAVAGLGDLRLHRVRGLQLAGAGAIALGDVRGVQLAGAGAIAAGDVRGVQLAGAGAIALGEVQGTQISGGFNLATGRVRGIQAAGGANLARDRSSLQIAPVNVADRGDVQVGVVNVARESDVQVGVVNVATESRAPIGLLSIVTRGRTDVEAWAETTGGAFAAVRHGGTVTHNLYGAGAILRDDTTWFALGFGLGGRIPLEIGAIDIDAVGWHLTESQRLTSGLSLLAQVRATLSVDVAPPLAVIAGIVENTFLSNHEDPPDLAVGPSWGSTEGDVTVRGWFSLFAGVRLH